MFNPASIGVVLGKTTVEIDQTVHVVKSFDHDEYALEDGTKLTQWKLLEHRNDGGVTLDADFQRFILHLVTMHVNMMAHVVPHLRQHKNVTAGMLWNVIKALEKETNPEKRVELQNIKKRVDTLRDLTLRIFTKAAVEDTLPAGFWAVDGNKPLHEFAKKAGSLSQLNFLDGLGCVADLRRVTGRLFTGDVVRGGFSEAPNASRARGSWKAKLRTVIGQLTCAYRLGRTLNLVEATTRCLRKNASF